MPWALWGVTKKNKVNREKGSSGVKYGRERDKENRKKVNVYHKPKEEWIETQVNTKILIYLSLTCNTYWTLNLPNIIGIYIAYFLQSIQSKIKENCF